MQQSTDLMIQPADSSPVVRYAVTSIMSAQSGLQSLHQLRRRQRAIQFKPVFYRLNLHRKSLANHCDCLPYGGVTRFHRYYAIIRLPVSRFAFLPSLLSLVRHTHFLARQNRVSRVAVYPQYPTCHALGPLGGLCNSPFSRCTRCWPPNLQIRRPFPYLSISRLYHFSLRPVDSLTLCLIVGITPANPRFTSRRLAKPYRSGTRTRQNKRPCSAALQVAPKRVAPKGLSGYKKGV